MVSEAVAAAKTRRGGAREGAGRPRRQTTLVSRRRADQYARDGKVLPVDVMMGTMRALWDEATLHPADAKGRRKARKPHELVHSTMKEANEIAKDVAPYMHPKLSSTEVGGPNGGPMELLVKRAMTSLQGLEDGEFEQLMATMKKLGLVSLANSDPLGGDRA